VNHRPFPFGFVQKVRSPRAAERKTSPQIKPLGAEIVLMHLELQTGMSFRDCPAFDGVEEGIGDSHSLPAMGGPHEDAHHGGERLRLGQHAHRPKPFARRSHGGKARVARLFAPACPLPPLCIGLFDRMEQCFEKGMRRVGQRKQSQISRLPPVAFGDPANHEGIGHPADCACEGRRPDNLVSVKILVVGSGAREHALLRALKRDPEVKDLHIAPGNAGTSALATTHSVSVSDSAAVAALAEKLAVDLVVIGPEVPLVVGAADAVRAKGIPAFGPSAAAARIEGSKAFAKEVMTAAGVPTASAISVTDAADIRSALDTAGSPYVVKDDGLAAGKGVVVTSDRDVAFGHAREVLDSGSKVLVESYLAGPEVSLFAVCDGTRAVPLVPAQDFKRVFDDDQGPNTGGMGAYAPLPWAPSGLVEQVQRTVLDPVLAEMSRRGCPFQGLLYAGLVLTATGPQVIEFNCRFGDPETQVVLELLNTPLGGLLKAAADGDLSRYESLSWREGAVVTVVLAAENYPGTPTTGDVILGVDDELILHAGTARDGGDGLVASGGRVLSVLGRGSDLAAARDDAYRRLAGVRLRGSHYRRDIALAAAEGRISVPGS
jgi:phosphoribosylamine--glycine ligase